MTRLTVNGKTQLVAARSLDQLLECLGYCGDRRGIAVALNGRVVPRGLWLEQPVESGDDIEIVGAVQGG